MSHDPKSARTGWFKSRRNKGIAIATGTAIALGSVFGVQAFADSKAYSHMTLAAKDSGGWHTMGRHRRHDRGHRFDRMSEVEIEAKIARMVGHVAVEIDATPEQREKITTLVTAIAQDIMPLREQMKDVRVDLKKLLTADTIDRVAMETLRKERLAEIDAISESVMTAAADVAEVLTPEQRKILDERIEQFASGRRGGHRGWRRH